MTFSWISSAGRPLPDAENHKLRGSRRCYANQANQAPAFDIGLSHCRAIAFDEVSFLGLDAHQCTRSPFQQEKIFNGTTHVSPKNFTIGFEDSPLSSLVNRVFEVSNVPPHIYILEFRIGTREARTEEKKTAARGKAKTIDAFFIKDFLPPVV